MVPFVHPRFWLVVGVRKDGARYFHNGHVTWVRL